MSNSDPAKESITKIGILLKTLTLVFSQAPTDMRKTVIHDLKRLLNMVLEAIETLEVVDGREKQDKNTDM